MISSHRLRSGFTAIKGRVVLCVQVCSVITIALFICLSALGQAGIQKEGGVKKNGEGKIEILELTPDLSGASRADFQKEPEKFLRDFLEGQKIKVNDVILTTESKNILKDPSRHDLEPIVHDLHVDAPPEYTSIHIIIVASKAK